MTSRIHARRIRRRQLLLGAAATALNICTAATVAAQPAPPVLQADGNTILASDQHQSDASVKSIVAGPQAELQGAAEGSTLQVTDNVLRANARANVAAATWEPDTTGSLKSEAATLSTGWSGTNASGGIVIASRQQAQGTAVVGKIGGAGSPTRLGAALTSVSDSSVHVDANNLEAGGTGNEASSALSLTNLSPGLSAGIVNDQAITDASRVRAAQFGDLRLSANALTDASVEISGNSTRALAHGNNAANALSVNAVAVGGVGAGGPPSTVDTGSNEGEVHAQFGVLSNQRLDGTVAAKNAGSALVQIGGAARGSSIVNDANQLAAGSYGNRVDNSLSLNTPTIATDNTGGGTANVTNMQLVNAVAVSARVGQGPRSVVLSDLAGSTASLSGNSVTAAATGNQADGNRLTVTAASLMPGQGSGGEGGGHGPGIPPVIGTAAVTEVGDMTVSAPLSVQNVQINQGLIAASQEQSLNSLSVGGALSGSALDLSGNAVTVSASGSRASNDLSISGSNVGSAADLNNLQLGLGSISATIGSTTNRSGFTAWTRGAIDDSTVAVLGNELTASANQNSATNALSVEGARLVSTSGHSNAEAGSLAEGLGAAGDFALANTQEILGGYQLPAVISAEVHGAFGATSGGPNTGSSFAVRDNGQTASATGNTVSNALALKSAWLGAPGEGAPGSALASTQSARANIIAASDMVLSVPAGLSSSSAEIAGNSSIAFARMNSASNALSIDAALIGPLSNLPAFVENSAGAPPQAMGDHVLANTQSATGSVSASSSIGAIGTNGPLDGASLVLNGNTAQASAAANSASNSLAMVSAVAPAASVALVNSQSSMAAVGATARLDAGGTGALSGSQSGISANSAIAQATGNGSSNAMTLSGATGYDCVPDLASVTTGPLNSGAGPAVLSNAQMNAGAVSSLALVRNASLTTPTGNLAGSAVDVTGNIATATAYGNSAANNITLTSATAFPAAGIVNNQVNTASVTAVAGAALTLTPAAMTGSRATFAGNAVTAQAVGNYASSTISFGR